MSDAVTLSRTARESLARGLNALQGDPNVPRQLLDLAAPIAQAMGSLHQIERSGGTQVMPGAQAAVVQIQHALAQLQAHPPEHPAVIEALEAVAAALGTVHVLARLDAKSHAVPAAPPAPIDPPAATPAAAAGPAPKARAAAAPAIEEPAGQGPAARAPAAREPGGAQAAAARAVPPAARPAGQAERAAAAERAAQPRDAVAPPPAGDGSAIAAELGAHSPSNFYKGLSGNDIIDHGGLFVSTYKLPKIGVPVRLRVALPGGYEFEASAIVRWRREPSDAGNDAPPGFGAQFTEIATEARQLVYRYVRNREPLFHDDL